MKSQSLRSLFLSLSVAVATVLAFGAYAGNKKVSPARSLTPLTPTPTGAVVPQVLHFHGNPNDDPPCTGSGSADIIACNGPILKTQSALGANPPAHWDAEPAVNGTAARNIYDPNWLWTLAAPTTLSGDMTVTWWASCGACGTGVSDAAWDIKIWKDGGATATFIQRVTATPALPNVPSLVSATITLPPMTANTNYVLTIDPVFVDSQQNTHIYYDGSGACPGDTGAGPCDSKVVMPVLDPNATPTPTPTPTPAPNYIKGGMTFSPNYTTKAPYIGQDVEPSLRCDKFGNCYVAPIRGVPGGTDLWYFDLRPTVSGSQNPNYDPFMRNPIYRGQPDKIADIPGNGTVGGDGGGDVDMAVGFNSEATEDPSAPPTLAYSSLVLANISTQRSTDRGATFVKNPAGNVTGGVPGDDRQWMEFFGSQYVYLIYRTLAPAIAQVQRSVDGGLTYGNTTVVGTIGQVGGVDVDQNDGTVYVAGSNGVVAVGIPPVPGPPSPTSLPPATYTVHSVAGTGNAHIFFTVKVASDGTVYACYSNDRDVFIKFSQDKGTTWSAAIRVSDGSETLTSVFPWMETGPTPGTIGVVWYGSNKATTGDDTADWHVFYAQGTTVTTNPSFRQAEASDHVIHGANISEAGLVVGGMSPNRNLADYFQIAFDPTGAAVIGYCDDHNDISGHAYVARQISGPGVNGGAAIPTPVEGSSLPPQLFEPKPTAASVGGILGSQVTDQRDDVRTGGNPQTGGTVVIPNDDPADILSVKYSTEGTAAQPVLVCTMKVSDMTAIPPSTNWRMHFTANAPNSVLSPTGEYTFGLSDRGDQFFVRASTDAASAQTFVYGTAKRNFDGTITYTDKGSADTGAFDQANKTITLKVAVSKLNAALAAGRPTLGPGSILAGLRATTFTTAAGSGNNRADTARGGTQFEISFPVPLTSVVSRKTHTGVGDFDVDLPLIGTRGVECRTGGANGDFKLVFTFQNNLTSVTSASVTSHDPATGTGTVSSSMIGPGLNQYTVNLTNVSNIQYITVTLANVQDSMGNFSASVPATMGVLLGDTSGNGSTNSTDVSQTKLNSGRAADSDTFRTDVTLNGVINSTDVTTVKAGSGTALPP